MTVLSTAGRSFEQKSQRNSIQSPTVSETAQFTNTFHFWNGDEYTGQFAVVKDKQKVVMQGKGVYITSDGQTYEGVWENDSLRDECKVTFPGEIVFSGTLDDMVIQGLGNYKFKEKIEMQGNFVNNRIIGWVYLKDPNQHKWKGKVEKKGGSINFYPLHPFWQSVLNLPTKAVQPFYGEAAEENENIWE